MDFIEKPSSAESSSTECKSESPISIDLDESKSLKQFCKIYPNKLKFTHININNIRNQLDLHSDQVKINVDILIISKTKVDESFLVCKFKIDGFNALFQGYKNQKGGDIMYVWEDLPAKLLPIDRTNTSCFVELKLKCTEWLIK